MFNAFSLAGLFFNNWALIMSVIWLWIIVSGLACIMTNYTSRKPSPLFFFAGASLGIWPMFTLAAGAVAFFFGAIFGPGMDSGLELIKYSELSMRNTYMIQLSLFVGTAIIFADFYMSGVLLGFRRSEYVKG